MFGTIEQILMLSRNTKVLQNDQAVLKMRHVGQWKKGVKFHSESSTFQLSVNINPFTNNKQAY